MPRRTRFVGTAMAVAAAIALTGCVDDGGPDPTPKPTQTAEARPTPSATPTPDPAAAPEPAPAYTAADTTRIIVRPLQLDLHAEDGTKIAELSYDADADTFIGTLADAFGGGPDVQELPKAPHWWPTTVYDWPGLRVWDDHEEDGKSSEMNLTVRFTHPIVAGGVEVSTVNGFRPGDSVPAFADEIRQTWPDPDVDVYGQVPAEFGPDLGPQSQAFPWPNAYAVSASNSAGWDEASNTASHIQAPWNFGVGHA